MTYDRSSGARVTLMLQDGEGQAWPFSLSRDCLCFIGRYKRVDGFRIDPALLFQGAARRY
ncbi:hypothetical protein WG908_11560 [Sphingobium sp. AN641]|uniref:hypothetical protein n=1 Tax=Sphingobium sp. AN641 TaxID=3133443 RepID=UPI0030C6395C